MGKIVKAWLITAAVAVTPLVAAGGARASDITFDTVPLGVFTGPATENGFTYARLSGGLFISPLGHPGQSMEGNAADGGGVLDITTAGARAAFTFSGLDYAAIGNVFNVPVMTQTLTVTGLLGGAAIGTDTYSVLNGPGNVSLKFTTEIAASLAGKTIDDLRITLNAGPMGVMPIVAPTNSNAFTESIDNLVLAPVAPVPEPASFALLGAGLVSAGLLSRARRGSLMQVSRLLQGGQPPAQEAGSSSGGRGTLTKA